MSAMLKVMKLLAAGAGKMAHSAAEHGLGVELRERVGEFVRRLRRGGLIFVGLIGGLLACSLLLHPIGLLLWVIALPLAAMAAALSMLWPTRRAQLRRRNSAPRDTLAALARSTRLSLERRTGRLPHQARAAARAAIGHLKEIANSPSGADADPLLQREAERLIGGHLPRLVDSYCALPEHERRGGSEADRHFTEGLTALAVELGGLSQRLSETRTTRFEIERRFISLRFPNQGDFAGAP